MAGQRPARERVGESISEFMDRRRQEVAASNAIGRAAAHEAYGKAIRSGQDLALRHPAEVTAHGAHLSEHMAKERPRTPGHGRAFARRKVGHPGFAESLIPVWGSGREAIADYQDGDYVGAALNGALAASDLFLATAVEKAVAKGGLYAIKGAIGEGAAKTNWKAVRRELGDKKLLDAYQHGHHWLIPQHWPRKAPTWVKKLTVPDGIKNHPLNIKGMPSREVHGRLHGRYKGHPRYGLLGRYHHGAPAWSKVATGSTAGHVAAAATPKKARHP
jgi:hypothetical protein